MRRQKSRRCDGERRNAKPPTDQNRGREVTRFQVEWSSQGAENVDGISPPFGGQQSRPLANNVENQFGDIPFRPVHAERPAQKGIGCPIDANIQELARLHRPGYRR
jgi:hypothetical protein